MRVVVTGASGALGAFVLEELVRRSILTHALSGTTSGIRSGIRLTPVDLSDMEQASIALNATKPDVIIHLAAVSSAVECFRERERAYAANVVATDNLAHWCDSTGARLVFASTDLVFSGDSAPYREDDEPDPRLVYGLWKRQSELRVLKLGNALVARFPLMYGRSRGGRPGFFDAALADLSAGKARTFFDDERRTPLDYLTAARALIDLVELGTTGIVHVAGTERVSRFELMTRAAMASGLDSRLISANQRADAPGPEPRPADVSLDTSRLASLLPALIRPTIEEAIARMDSR